MSQLVQLRVHRNRARCGHGQPARASDRSDRHPRPLRARTYRHQASALATFRLAATRSLLLSTRVMRDVEEVDYRATVQLECCGRISHGDLQVAHVSMPTTYFDTSSAIIYLDAPKYPVRRWPIFARGRRWIVAAILWRSEWCR